MLEPASFSVVPIDHPAQIGPPSAGACTRWPLEVLPIPTVCDAGASNNQQQQGRTEKGLSKHRDVKHAARWALYHRVCLQSWGTSWVRPWVLPQESPHDIICSDQ